MTLVFNKFNFYEIDFEIEKGKRITFLQIFEEISNIISVYFKNCSVRLDLMPFDC